MQIHLTPDILFAVIGFSITAICSIAWYLYTQLSKKLDQFHCFARECQESLSMRFADKEYTNESIKRIVQRQDSLRESLPKDFITRQEVAVILMGIDTQLTALKEEMKQIPPIREDIKVLLQKVSEIRGSVNHGS